LFGVASGVANEGQIGLNNPPTCNRIVRFFFCDS